MQTRPETIKIIIKEIKRGGFDRISFGLSMEMRSLDKNIRQKVEEYIIEKLKIPQIGCGF